jgi:hypothetical protein
MKKLLTIEEAAFISGLTVDESMGMIDAGKWDGFQTPEGVVVDASTMRNENAVKMWYAIVWPKLKSAPIFAQRGA